MIIHNCEFNGVAGIVGYPVCCIIWRHELKLLLAPSLHFLVIVEIMIKDAHDDDYNNDDDENERIRVQIRKCGQRRGRVNFK